MPGLHLHVKGSNSSVKEVSVAGGGKALLIKDSGQFYAVSSKCTHYGAPLEKGKQDLHYFIFNNFPVFYFLTFC